MTRRAAPREWSVGPATDPARDSIRPPASSGLFVEERGELRPLRLTRCVPKSSTSFVTTPGTYYSRS